MHDYDNRVVYARELNKVNDHASSQYTKSKIQSIGIQGRMRHSLGAGTRALWLSEGIKVACCR